MAEAEAKKEKSATKKTRAVRPVYVIMRASDANGNAISLTKEQVDVISVHKDSDELLDMLDSGGLPEGSFYKRIALG